MRKNWTGKFIDLEVGQSFETDQSNYVTMNGTKQRILTRFPERNYSVIRGGNLNGGKITVKRNEDKIKQIPCHELKAFITVNEKSDKLGKQILEYFKLG